MSFLLRRPPPFPSSLSSLFHFTPKPSPLFASHLLPRPFSTSPQRPIAKMTIIGRLAAEPELVPTASGNDMVRYSLGTSSGPRDNRQTSWWKVACFAPEGGSRDYVMGLGKGSMVYLEGEASMRKFQKADEAEQQALSIIQRNIEVLDRRPHSSDELAPASESEEFPRANESDRYTRANESETRREATDRRRL